MVSVFARRLTCGPLFLICLFMGSAAALSAPPPSAPGPSQASSTTFGISPQNPEPSPGISHKQRRELIKANFEKMKHDADELAALAKNLQEELNKSNENVLSLEIVDKAEKIEKLAKKIKGVAKGY